MVAVSSVRKADNRDRFYCFGVRHERRIQHVGKQDTVARRWKSQRIPAKVRRFYQVRY